MPWLKRGINRFIPSAIWQSNPQIPITLKELPSEGIALDIGAGGRLIGPRVFGVDFIRFPNTSVVGNIHALPFLKNSISVVFCTGTLEHVEDPSQAMREIFRILELGGILHLEVPFMQPYHKDPADYWRWTLDGLRLFASKHNFSEVRSGMHIGPTSAMNQLVIAYFQSWFHNCYIRKGIDIVLSGLLFPFKYIDVWLVRCNQDMPSGVFYVGRKNSA